MRRLLCGVLVVTASLVFAPSAMAGFGLQSFEVSATNQNGSPDVQAGSHPYELTTSFLLHPPKEEFSHLTQEGTAKDIRVDLPPGFVGNPTATPRCTYQVFIRQEGGCPDDTVVGASNTFFLGGVFLTTSSAVYNIEPSPGIPAEFAFKVKNEVPVFLDASVRTGGDYGLTVTVPNINEAAALYGSEVTIWGVPADPSHDSIRGNCLAWTGAEREGVQTSYESTGGNCPANVAVKPFLTNPTSCGVPRTASISVDDWEEPGNFVSLPSALPPLSGCEKLDFSPTLTVTPDKPDASTSSGLTVNVHVPQESTTNPVGLAEADVRDTTVALPPGVALNPAGANGLEACSSNPGALAADQLGSPGDGIGFKGFEESKSEPGVSLPIFTSALPGSIAATDAVSTGSLAASEDVIQPGLNFCSNASKIGTVRIKTPLLEHELTGTIYLAAQEANPFGSLMAIYFIAEEPVAGVMVKLPGEVSLCKGAGEMIAGQTCQALGQIVTTLLNTPQLPFEEFEAHFFGGERAPLTTPADCGTYTTETSFVPWSGTPAKHPSAPFQIEHGPGGGACPGSSLPFRPSLTGGALNVNAGAFSPFTLTMNRSDGEQNMQSVEAHLPPGLSGILSNVELCPEPQANLGECGPNSLIGETTVSVGVGGDPFTVTGGKFYLTGPYNGSGACTVGQAGCAPFGITFVVPAKAGPFDLAHTKSFSPACDCILVRGKIEVNPITAALTVTSNPPGTPDAIPTSIEGIPLEIQHINATTTRGNFQFNPTNCSKMEVTGTIHSSEGGTDTIGVPFQVTNCKSLNFTPKFSVSTQGKTSKANGASLTTKVTEPSEPFGSQANLAYVKVELPGHLPSRLTTLQKACTAKQFETNPAACPAESKIGYAVVHTPLVPVPLTGPAIFVSHGDEAFPSLTMVLQGYGVTIDLVGATDIKNGVTSTTFKTVPDQPFSTFELTLPEGPYSALAANGNLCHETKTVTVKKKETKRVHGKLKKVTVKVKKTEAEGLVMPNEFVGQNGAVIKQDTAISVTGCKATKPAKKKKAKKKAKAKKGKKK